MIHLSPSLMCINIENLKKDLAILDKTEVDSYHIDIMDGNYVSNFAMGLGDIWAVQNISTKPFEVHLMVENTDCIIQLLNMKNCKTIYIHPETCKHAHLTIMKIKNMNKRAGIVLNPGTSVDVLLEYINLLDAVLLMSVNPGYAGQAFIESSYEKLERIKNIVDKADHEISIMVDGAINKERLYKLHELGADGFVLGTAGLFNNNNDYENNLKELLY